MIMVFYFVNNFSLRSNSFFLELVRCSYKIHYSQPSIGWFKLIDMQLWDWGSAFRGLCWCWNPLNTLHEDEDRFFRFMENMKEINFNHNFNFNYKASNSVRDTPTIIISFAILWMFQSWNHCNYMLQETWNNRNIHKLVSSYAVSQFFLSFVSLQLFYY